MQTFLTRLLLLNSESGVEPELEQDERVLDRIGSSPPKSFGEVGTETRAPKSENVTCVPLASPTAGASPSVSGPEAPESRNPKRRKLSAPRSPSIYPEVAAKSATSIPAMVIPHLVSHRTRPFDS